MYWNLGCLAHIAGVYEIHESHGMAGEGKDDLNGGEIYFDGAMDRPGPTEQPSESKFRRFGHGPGRMATINRGDLRDPSPSRMISVRVKGNHHILRNLGV